MRIIVSDIELQRAKDVLESCDLVSPSTKGCYSSRIALWMHYCAVCCNGDEQVTGQRLADYVEWMVSSGSAERIRQGTTHIQQVLRNQLQGVLCYWRIQHANVPNAEDPRGDSIFKTKWQEIVMRYPSTRHSRRAEPIYGVPRVTTNIVPKVENPSAMGANGGSTGGAPYPGRMGAQGPHAAPGGYPAMRQPHLVNASSPSMPPASAIQHGRNPNYRPHPSQMNQPRQSSPMHGPHPYASQQGAPQRSWYQSPYDERAQQTRHQSPSAVNGQAQYPGPNPNRSTIPGPGAGRYPQLSGPYGQQSQTVPERVPPVSGAYYPSRPSYPAAPQHSNSMAFQRQPASHTDSQDPRASPRMHQQQSSELQNRQTDESLASNPSVSKGASFNVSTGANNPETVSRQHNPNTLRMSAESDEGAVSGMSNRVPDSNDISRLTSDNATAVPSSPRAPRSQYILEGILPEEIPEWTIEDEEESAEIPEGHLLNQNESIALSIRQLGVRPEIQMQTRAHVLLGLSSWISASSRTDLTLSDIWTEEAVGISLPSTQPHAKRPDSITMSETDPDNESKDEPENGPENRSEVSSKDASKDQDGAENSNAEPAESEQSNEGDKEPTPEEEMTEGLDHQKPSEQQQENADDAGSVNTGTDLEKQADSGLENEAVAEEENEAEDKDVSAETSETKPSETSNNRQDSQQPLQPLRVLSIALHAPGNRTANNASANDKAFVLRHRNPLLCPWGALAFMLFSRWHVANEPAPDFSTSAWQSLKLFPELSEQGSSSADNSFKHLFEEALSGVTKDK
ncbi:hypothetical protein GGH99_006040 [Coemansia sp. RSA 1285]|nr:hypothetical protein GGH99_006040 [Coemansia sp. RSA 1285]